MLRLPHRVVDFSGEHITYNLPRHLAVRGLSWQPMRVHTSPRAEPPIYAPRFDAPRWRPDLAAYRYGLGNFYSLDAHHNWLERAFEDVADDCTRTLPEESGGLPLAFIKAYTRNFLDDLANSRVQMPEVPA
jgi:hypothetical protein